MQVFSLVQFVGQGAAVGCSTGLSQKKKIMPNAVSFYELTQVTIADRGTRPIEPRADRGSNILNLTRGRMLWHVLKPGTPGTPRNTLEHRETAQNTPEDPGTARNIK